MANISAPRDNNRVPTIIGTSSVDGNTPVVVYADPITHRLYVDLQGGSTINFVDNETPTGTVDGNNVTFSLAYAPSPAGSLQLFTNGQLLTSGGEDYTLLGTTVTMVNAPPGGSIIRCWYRR